MDGQPGYFSASTESGSEVIVANLGVNDTFKTGGISYQVISVNPLEVQVYSKDEYPR